MRCSALIAFISESRYGSSQRIQTNHRSPVFFVRGRGGIPDFPPYVLRHLHNPLQAARGGPESFSPCPLQCLPNCPGCISLWYTLLVIDLLVFFWSNLFFFLKEKVGKTISKFNRAFSKRKRINKKQPFGCRFLNIL